MTEPGTCDILTADPPPIRPPSVQETTYHGWTLRHTEILRDPQVYRTEVLHPWLGVMSSFVWTNR